MAFPVDEIDVEVGLFMNGAWVDAIIDGNGIRVSDGITISRGRSNWASQVDPSRARFTLDNRDGRWSPDYSSGAHAGNYKRNIPCRVGVGGGPVSLLSEGLSSTVATTPDIAGTGGGSPTAPAFVDVTTDAETANATTHTYDLPATVAVNDRLLLIIAAGHQSLAPISDMSAWTLVHSDNLYTPWHGWRVYEIEVTTSSQATALAGSTVQFSTTSAVKSSSQVIRTSGARGGSQGVAWDFQAPSATANGTAPDPPSLTASYGADEQRWYAVAIYGSGTDRVTAYPTSYTSISDSTSATNVLIATAHRTTSAATEDPGAYTLAGNENWQAFTFVYRAEEDTSSDGVMDIAGDIDLRIELQLLEDPLDSDFNPSPSDIVLAKKTAGFDGFEWRLYRFEQSVHMSLWWDDTSGGFNQIDTQFDVGTALPASVRSERIALRATLDVNNGAAGHDVAFYYSDSISGSWTQIGSTVTTSGTTDIKTNDAELTLVSGGNFVGRVYAFQMLDGIGGTAACNPDFTAQTAGAASFNDAAGRTWTIGSGGSLSDKRWRFHGEMSSLPVRWSVDGADVTAPAEASGILRRLRQGSRPLLSPIRRAIIDDFEAFAQFGFNIQYWPLEEDKAVTQFGAAYGTAPFVISGNDVNAAAERVMDGSDQLPTLGTSSITATVDNYSGPYDEWLVHWIQRCPPDFTGDNFDYLRIDTTDMTWEVRYRDDSGGQLQLRARRGLTNVYASAWTSFNVTGASDRAMLTVTQSGSNVTVQLVTQGQNDTVAGGFTTTSAVAGAPGRVTGITFNQGGDVGSWAFGHVALYSTASSASYVQKALNGYTSEKAGDRVARICQEEGIAVTIQGDPADTEIMGPQQPGTFLDVLEQCAATDLGILFESRETFAVGYRTRQSMRNQTAQAALDYAAGEVARSPELDRDDQDFANDITVRNWSGATARATLDDGSALSISQPPTGAGRYDSVFTVNSQDNRLPTIASNILTLSTADEPRVSRLAVALHHGALVADATLTGNVLDLVLGDLVTIENNLNVALGTTTLSQILQGYTERIFPFEWTIDMLTSPGSPWGGGAVVGPAEGHSVRFREGTALATPGSPDHVLTALGALGYIGDGVPSLGGVGTHDFHTSVSSPITMCGEEFGVAPTINTGDLVVFAGQGNETHSFGSEWTVHLNTTHDGTRVFVVSTIAGANTDYDITWTGSTDSIDGQMYVFPGAGGVSAFVSSTSDVDGFSGSSTFPTVSVADDQSIVLLGSIGSGNEIGTVGSPLSVTGFTATAQNLFGYYIGAWTKTADAGSESGHTITYPGGEFRTEFALVVEPQDVTIERSQLDAILDNWVAGTGGTTRNVTSAATMTTALANAVPGDLIRVTTGFDSPVNVRGDRYGISGATLTTSTDGGLPGLPIIVTCADGVYLDDNNVSSNDGVIDFQNCVHVWGIGLNVRDGQFGIRCNNWGGEPGFPAYIAYCSIENIGDAGLVGQGWFSSISGVGGTPPAGAGNEWGYSDYFVWESNTIDGVGERSSGYPGEALYTGYGGSPGWKSYAKDFWIRGNFCTDWKSNGIDVKPGCHRGRITDNEFYLGHGDNGAPVSLLYVAAGIDDRPAAFDFDPQIYFEGNRVVDSNLTNTDPGSPNIMGYIGLTGIRIAHNVMWAHPQTGVHATWRIRNEKGTNDTEALAEMRADPTWVINNTCWSDDSISLGGYGASPGTAFPSSVTVAFNFRNNIVDNGTTADGEVDAAASDFIATVPAIGVAGDAQWLTYGRGSAFDLDPDSALVASGESITDITFFIEKDISNRDLDKTTPNPGAFQQHPANK